MLIIYSFKRRGISLEQNMVPDLGLVKSLKFQTGQLNREFHNMEFIFLNKLIQLLKTKILQQKNRLKN